MIEIPSRDLYHVVLFNQQVINTHQKPTILKELCLITTYTCKMQVRITFQSRHFIVLDRANLKPQTSFVTTILKLHLFHRQGNTLTLPKVE